MTDTGSRPLFLGTIALVAGACCIALAPIMVKLSPLGPQASAFWRLLFAIPFLAVWAALEARQRQGDVKSVQSSAPIPWSTFALAGFLFALDLATWHAGIIRTSAANATFLSNLTPIVVAAFAWLTTRAVPKRAYWIAVAVALAGSLLLSGGAPGSDPQHLLGDGLSVLTSVWYGLYLIAVAQMRERSGAGKIMLGTSAVAAVFCLAITLLFQEPLMPDLSGRNWLAVWWPLLVLGLIVHVGGQGLLAVGFGTVPTHIASVLILLQPVLVAILGWHMLNEALSFTQLCGAILVLIGVWLAKRSG